ncbi:hypothetical protein [Bosea vaviloviae]|uniref:Uncharacterized protein n=1 Tax=Bosea vaviloviae TaxID=1526658 RepID=A0A0N1N2D8_9HYPH|nr:hypothetical protein [Bosea vaviloviae]KPH80671.1 hypothetical protein AE618_13110 [Bosea vaviloviae]
MKPLAEQAARSNGHSAFDWKKAYSPTRYRGHCKRCRSVLEIMPRGLMPAEAEQYQAAGSVIAETMGFGNYSVVQGSALAQRCWG